MGAIVLIRATFVACCLVGSLGGCLADTEPPRVLAFEPEDPDLRGVGRLMVSVDVQEDGEARAILEVDGVAIGEQVGDSCSEVCRLVWTLDTSTLAVGTHLLHVRLVDDSGNEDEVTKDVLVDDIVKITAIEVTGESDFGALDIEVHLVDQTTSQVIGCAGEGNGLEQVDASDVLYPVDAILITPRGTPVGAADLGTNPLLFAVWEDDGAPCPGPTGGDDDFLGASPAKTRAEWEQVHEPLSFGTTTSLTVVVGRPHRR